MKQTVACIIGLLVMVHGTAAAPITWQPTQKTTGVANLLTGPHVYAVNGGSSAVTVNGITFDSVNLGDVLQMRAVVPDGEATGQRFFRFRFLTGP
jgi:hypothetical protein